jgi:hypothetical protein
MFRQIVTGSEVQVTGKGNFTKHDGTVKKFNYSCRVNTAEDASSTGFRNRRRNEARR